MKLELNTYYKVSNADVDNFIEALHRDFDYVPSRYENLKIKTTCGTSMFGVVMYPSWGYFSGLYFDGTEVEYIPSDVDWV